MLRAAIFDMDGLLVDSEPAWQEAEIEVFATLGVELTRSDCWQTKGLRVNETVAYWFARRSCKGATPQAVQERLVAGVAERLRARAEPKEGARHAVDFFRSKGLRLGLASSSSASLIHAVLERLRMAEDFEVIRSAVDEPFGKPHPAVYRTAAAQLSIAPSGCVALEDGLPGIAAARAAGMLCIGVPDDQSGPAGQADRFREGNDGADIVLKSLRLIDDEVWAALNALPRRAP